MMATPMQGCVLVFRIVLRDVLRPLDFKHGMWLVSSF
jgi:hypothetical protein